MKYSYKFAAVFLAVLLLLFTIFPAAAEDDGTSGIPLNKAKAYLIGTADGSVILKSTELNAKISPCSTVKIMSGYLLCRYFANKLNETVTVEAQMVKNVIGRSVGMKAGATPTVRDLLYIGFCGGYNDAIAILGWVAYGSDTALTDAMNAEAARLGMTSTHYANATGIHDDTAYTTLGDLQKLAVAAYSEELFMTVTSASAYSTEGLYSPFTFSNTNQLIANGNYRNSICRGLNAGNTPESGYCAVTVAEKKGVSYLCIVMGAESDVSQTYSYLLANKLIAWALNRYGTMVLLDTSTVICEIPVSLSVKTDTVNAVAADSVSAFVPLSYTVGKEIEYKYELNSETLEAPVEIGSPVGRVTVYCDGKAVATVAMVTQTSVEKSSILAWIEAIRSFTQSDFFAGTLITALILTTLWIVFRALVNGSRKKARRR